MASVEKKEKPGYKICTRCRKICMKTQLRSRLQSLCAAKAGREQWEKIREKSFILAPRRWEVEVTVCSGMKNKKLLFMNPSITTGASSTTCACVSQVVPRPPVRVQRREAPGGPRRARHLPGPRVHVQTRRLCPVGLDQWEEQNWSQEGFSHQDNVPGVNPNSHRRLYVCVTTPVVHNSAITHTNVLFLASVALFRQLRVTAWWNTSSFANLPLFLLLYLFFQWQKTAQTLFPSCTN